MKEGRERWREGGKRRGIRQGSQHMHFQRLKYYVLVQALVHRHSVSETKGKDKSLDSTERPEEISSLFNDDE